MEEENVVIIYWSTNRTGSTFALRPDGQRRVRAAFAEAHLPPRVFVAHESDADRGTIHSSLRRLVPMMLTGLPEEKLRTLGEIQFVTGFEPDAQTGRQLNCARCNNSGRVPSLQRGTSGMQDCPGYPGVMACPLVASVSETLGPEPMPGKHIH